MMQGLAEFVKELRNLADYMESQEGQDMFEDHGATEESFPKYAIKEILHYAYNRRMRTDRVIWYSYLRFDMEMKDNDYGCDTEWRNSFYKLDKLVDRKEVDYNGY